MKTSKPNAEFIKAWADGDTIEASVDGENWVLVPDDMILEVATAGGMYTYRIKPEVPWYRVALMNEGDTVSVSSEAAEATVERAERFSQWITERTEYTV